MLNPSRFLLSLPALPAFAALAALAAPGVASAQSGLYKVIDLGVVPGQSPMAGVGAAVLTPDGRKVGGTSVWEPYVWDSQTGMRALPKLPGFLNAEVFDVRPDGSAVGSCGYVASGSNAQIAAFWDAQGNVTPIGRFSGPFSLARVFGAGGTVFGEATVLSGSNYVWHAFEWSPANGMVDITPGARSARVFDSNSRGQVCMTIDGAGILLDPLSGRLPLGGVPSCIAEDGTIAGLAAGQLQRWSRGGGWQAAVGPNTVGLGLLGGINRLGQIVGTQFVRYQTSPPRYYRYGHLFSDGVGYQKLDEVVDPSPPVRVGYVSGLTDDGVILAEGSIGSDNRAMLLVPRWFSHYGSACPTSAGLPAVGVAGTPKPSGAVALLANGGAGSPAGIFVVSPAPATLPLAGCTILADLQHAVLVSRPLDAAGRAHLTVPLPANLSAGSAYVQFLALDPQAPNGYFGASRGLRIDVR